jgi:hypothetical protein
MPIVMMPSSRLRSKDWGHLQPKKRTRSFRKCIKHHQSTSTAAQPAQQQPAKTLLPAAELVSGKACTSAAGLGKIPKNPKTHWKMAKRITDNIVMLPDR